jgi:hypothetical protein
MFNPAGCLLCSTGQIQDEPLCEWLPRLRKGLFLSRQALSGLTHLHINFPVEDCLQLAHLTCLQQLSLAEEDPLFSFPAGLGKCTALLKLELLTDAPTASSHVQVGPQSQLTSRCVCRTTWWLACWNPSVS